MIFNKKDTLNDTNYTSHNSTLMLKMVTSYSIFLLIILVSPRSETCSGRRRKRLPVSYLSMRSMPSVKSVTDRWAVTMRENRP